MLSLISLALGAITEGLKLANTAAARKYVDAVTELRLELQAAEARPYGEQDDQEIVSLYAKLSVWMQGAEQAIKSAESQKT